MPRVKPARIVDEAFADPEGAFSAVLPHLAASWWSTAWSTAFRGAWGAAPSLGHPVSARIRADATGLTLDERFVPRADIRTGLLLRGPVISVLVQGRRIDRIVVESVEQGRRLLRALKLDVTQRVAVFTARPRLAPRLAVVLLGALLCAAHLELLVPPLVLALAVSTLIPRKVEVGADGLSIRQLGRDRFIPFSAIDSAMRASFAARDRRGDAVSVLLRSGEDLRLHIGLDGATPTDASALFIERVREGMESFHGGDLASDAARLRRGDRDVATWVDALRSLGAGANADLRTAPLPRERLLRIVEDPAGKPADRAAAAVALGADLDERARARLREIAAATAGAKLRVAIEAVADDAHPASLHEALDDVTSEEGDERLELRA